MADLPVGAYRGGSLDCQIIYDKDDLPIGFSQRGVVTYFPSVNTNPFTGEVEINAAGAVFSQNNRALRSILVAGGDHPYKQWWGTNGRDGLYQMYADAGIKPYIAICADESVDGTSGKGATLGKLGMLTYEQAQELESRGVEFIGHGSRHVHFWELFNTGIRVWYTGAESTPTVNITSTQLTTSTSVVGATNFTWVANPTLAQLQTSIRALAGWNCELATELTGAEPSQAMMPLQAARSVIPNGGDLTNSNQRFAAAGGIMIRYTGTTYRDISISVNDGSNFFSIFADGARLLAQSTSATLTAIVSAINALNIAGLTALVMDNGYAAQSVAGSTALNPGQKFRETYCFGDESGLGLARIGNTQSINFTGLQVCGGLGLGYVIRRQIEAVKERSEALYGVKMESFAQSGGRLYPWHMRNVADEHVQFRVNRNYSEQNGSLSPFQMPVNYSGNLTGLFTSYNLSSNTPYQEADVNAVLYALADTGGWLVNWLNHLVTPTPGDPSPYTGLNQHSPAEYASSADQDEGPFYRELQVCKSLIGKFDVLTPSESERQRAARKGPNNLIFNPKFRNGRSNNLLGITTNLGGSTGVAMPGWRVIAAATDYSTFAVDEATRTLTIVTNGALGSNRAPVGTNIFLEPGKTYDIGATLNLFQWGGSNTVRFSLSPMQNSLGDANAAINSQPFFAGFFGDACFTFTVPDRDAPTPARVQSLVLSAPAFTTETITVNIDNRGTSAAIPLNGLTTAKAIANAINTALAADAAYAGLAQYHTCATAVDNRLVITAPSVNNAPADSGSLMTIANGTGTPLVTLFGAGVSTVRATSKSYEALDTRMVGYRLSVVPSSTSATQTLTLTAPYCREVRL